jgi:hypothetical protein
MDLCSKTRRERLHWPLAAATVLILASAPAFADDGDRSEKEMFEDSNWAFHMRNPCYRNPATGKREFEFVDGSGTQRTTTRNTQKRDGRSEMRIREQAQGSGVGSRSGVPYKVAEDHLAVTRMQGAFRQIVDRRREMGNPEKKFVLGIDTGARGFFVTTTIETIVSPAQNTRDVDVDEKCRDRNGKERGDDDHSDD